MRNSGIYIYVAMSGIVNVVITNNKQIAATKASAITIGIIPLIIARRGLP
jgi:hypothetical protein